MNKSFSVIDIKSSILKAPYDSSRKKHIELMNKPATKSVLLTGATGFLGRFLLINLLQQSKLRIFCLLRCKSASHGLLRIKEALNESALVLDQDKIGRLVIIPCDFDIPNLGLSESIFNQLNEEVSQILHCAANTNFNLSFNDLKQVNVDSTAFLIKLAMHRQPIPITYISTLSVFDSLNRSLNDEYFEHLDVAKHTLPFYGYAQSKLVSEQLLYQATLKGLSIRIMRPGRICWHSQTGIGHEHDFFEQFLQMMFQFMDIPDINPVIDLFPVDILSRYIVALFLNDETLDHAFHFCNSKHITLNSLRAYCDKRHFKISNKPCNQWLDELVNLNCKFSSFTPFLSMTLPNSKLRILDYYASQFCTSQFSMINTAHFIPRLQGISFCPDKLLDIYFKKHSPLSLKS